MKATDLGGLTLFPFPFDRTNTRYGCEYFQKLRLYVLPKAVS